MTELNRHNDATGIVQSLDAQAGRPFLGDIALVRRLVHEFAAGILTRYDEVGHGVLTPNDAADADRAECRRLGGVFCGKDAGYAPVAGWTGPELAAHLGQHMAHYLPPEDNDVEQVGQAFAVLAHKLYDTIRTLKDGDADHAARQVEADCNSLADQLVGMVAND